jgi:hypothetical protein
LHTSIRHAITHSHANFPPAAAAQVLGEDSSISTLQVTLRSLFSTVLLLKTALQALVTKEHAKLQHLSTAMVDALKVEQGLQKPKVAKQPFDAYAR